MVIFSLSMEIIQTTIMDSISFHNFRKSESILKVRYWDLPQFDNVKDLLFILSSDWLWSLPLVHMLRIQDWMSSVVWGGKEISSGWKGGDVEKMPNTWRMIKRKVPVMSTTYACVEKKATAGDHSKRFLCWADILQKIRLSIRPFL